MAYSAKKLRLGVSTAVPRRRGSAKNLGRATKQTYQMGPGIVDEARWRSGSTSAEGADMVMVSGPAPIRHRAAVKDE